MKNQDNKHIRKSKSTKISIVITSIIAILLFIVIGYLIYYYFIPKPKQYKLYIKNPNLIEAEVYIDGKFTGNLIKNDLVKFKKPQNFILKIKDLEAKYEEYIAEIVLNDDHNKLTIDYSPSLIPKPLIAVKEQFILSINNMTEIDPDLFINNENIGKLSNNIRKIYTKPQNLVLKFEDETGKYKEIESIIELNDENNDATFDYNPPKIPQQQIVKKLKKDKVVEKPKEKKIVVKPEEENFELVINNKVDIDPEVFIDNISKGFLSQKSKFLYTEPQNFSLKIEDKNGKYKTFTEQIELNKKNSKKKINYSPIEIEKPNYTLIIKNPQELNGQVLLDETFIGNLSGQKQFHYRIPNTGSFVLKIEAERELEETIVFSDKKKTQTISYDPIQYTLEINNNLDIDPEVFIDKKLKGLLSNNMSFSFPDQQKFHLEIIDKTNTYNTIQQEINLDKKTPKVTIKYKPSKKEKYLITIDNPNKINAKIKMDGKEEIQFDESFAKTFSDQKTRIFTISAKGYNDLNFEADFSKKSVYKFSYSPVPLKYKLRIKNTPPNGNIFLNGERLDFTTNNKETIIENLDFGREYEVLIKDIPKYVNFTKKIKIVKDLTEIFYDSTVELGILRFNPPLSTSLLKNTRVWLDDIELVSSSEISDLVTGNHKLDILFDLEDYQQKITKSVNIQPTNNDDTKATEIELAIDAVNIKSNITDTKIFVDNRFTGFAPIVVPFMNTTLSTIRAEHEGQMDQVEDINPEKMDGKELAFHFKSADAEKLFMQAEELIMQYREHRGVEGKGFLIDAHINLDEARAIDSAFSEVYVNIMYIITEKLVDALDGNDEYIAIELLQQLEYYKGIALQYLKDPFTKGIMYKNMGKGYFEYAQKFLSDIDQYNYLRTQSLPMLEKFVEERNKKIDSVDYTISQLYDRDEGDFYLAKCYQSLYNVKGESEYKTKAERSWKKNKFSPYTNQSGDVMENPFKNDKINWLNELLKN